MVGSIVRPGDAEAYHFCGHIYTTDGCPHPTGLPRIDRRGRPLRAADGRRVDDLGRLIDGQGRPVDEDDRPLTDLEGRPLPARAPHRRVPRRGPPLLAPAPDGRVVVPLLRRPRPQAHGLLRRPPAPDQRRQVAQGLLLRRPEGVLRHVLPELGAVLTACLIAAALAAGVTGAWSPCGLSMVDTLAPARLRRARSRTSLARLRDVRARRAARRRAHLRRAGPARRGARRGHRRRARRRRGRRGGRRGGRGARPADRPADPPPGPRGVAAHAARPGRRRGLRRPARPRVHDLRAQLRGLGAGGDERRRRRSRARARDGPRLRRRPRAARHRARARRGHAPRRRDHRRDAPATGDPARPAAARRRRAGRVAIALGAASA